MIPGYEGLTARYGDLHNHCDLSYGRGSPQEALTNARLQLDFASLTVHGAWPDVPRDDPALDYLVAYHERGFERAREGWDDYLALIDDADEPGRFVTLPSFEWHSMAYGDHCVYYRGGAGRRIVDAPDLQALRDAASEAPGGAWIVPHHIAYRRGLRGIDWDAFDPALSPVAEIVSFHGSAESCDGPLPYLHAMGPRDERGTARFGWRQGHRFGVIGATDHHAAVPGAYGYGRTGAWLSELSRDALWDALQQRRTYALTGDRIALAFSVNGTPMGGVAPPATDRAVEVDVRGGDGLDYVEVLHDERVVHRETVLPVPADRGRVKVHVEVGWGEANGATPWDVDLQVRDGALVGVEPRFRGPFPSARPAQAQGEPFAPHRLSRDGDAVRFTTRTFANPYSAVPATEGVCLEMDVDEHTALDVVANGRRWTVPLRDLREGSRSLHLGGFVSPAVRVRRAVAEAEFACRFRLPHSVSGARTDAYRVRVRQRNDQWAWSSPVWVSDATPGEEGPR
jgi:hypothetical protein